MLDISAGADLPFFMPIGEDNDKSCCIRRICFFFVSLEYTTNISKNEFERIMIMGWDFSYKPKSMSVKEYLESQFNADHYKVLDCKVIKLRTAYMAIQTHDGVWGYVCLLRYSKDSYYNFGYKVISEFAGPWACDCPKSIMDQLSPLPDGSDHAKEWRDNCWKKIGDRDVSV